MNPKTTLFLKIFKQAKKHYGKSTKRLAAESWPHPWQTLISTIYSAQARDELTIPVMESAFAELPTLHEWANAPVSKIESLTRKINYYKTKSKNSKAAAQMLISQFKSRVPDTIESLITLPGVGRKTANIIITEVYKQDGICVDTHVHRLSNVLGIVKTRSPTETEFELMKVSPRKYWSEINRIFVLWGKEVPGRDKKRIMAKINS